MRGTDEQPVVVKSVKDEAKEADDHNLAVWTKWLGIATFLLVAVGVGQFFMFWRQLRLMAKGAKDAAIAARAAEKSVDAAEHSLSQLERPYVYGGVGKAGFKVEPGDGRGRVKGSDDANLLTTSATDGPTRRCLPRGRDVLAVSADPTTGRCSVGIGVAALATVGRRETGNVLDNASAN
ncbi:hypothetical protein [Ralstonia psammae]|uniref:hypothetical protein n=1 Tax=Ralstonia psammae TaxID=3058598 RepID=UPI00292D0C2D|nr:hypothetical protein [Ralstonia sp. LMG 19083]